MISLNKLNEQLSKLKKKLEDNRNILPEELIKQHEHMLQEFNLLKSDFEARCKQTNSLINESRQKLPQDPKILELFDLSSKTKLESINVSIDSMCIALGSNIKELEKMIDTEIEKARVETLLDNASDKASQDAKSMQEKFAQGDLDPQAFIKFVQSFQELAVTATQNEGNLDNTQKMGLNLLNLFGPMLAELSDQMKATTQSAQSTESNQTPVEKLQSDTIKLVGSSLKTSELCQLSLRL